MRDQERYVLRHGNTVERENAGLVNMEGFDGEYMSYRDSVVDAKERQISDPKNPDRPFARDLRIEIIDKLGLEDPADFDNVEFYSALGTSFDTYHGVDCFVEVATEDGLKRVTIDLTTREKGTFKADILIEFPNDNLDPDLDESEYLGIIGRAADAIVKKINNSEIGQKIIYHQKDMYG